MSRYLYGASVQGIQEFIFKTNDLKSIVGASEIVKSLVQEFENISGYKKGNKNILLNAAGNIKAIFDDKEILENIVLNFPKQIMQKAYGITISQAVVKIKDNYTQYDIDELEKKLKTQRNKPSIPLDSSINIMKLAPKTAKPLINNKDEDKATNQKINTYKTIEKDETYKELKDISNKKNKIAVIHIDGNGLGQIVPKLGTKLSSFSTSLDNATKNAVNIAKQNKKVREIIVGGDDVTVICDANDALSFVSEFLENFEKETSKIEELNGIKIEDKQITKLTACAGIAYCNEKYPFHYAVNLAEILCGIAKKESERKASCLMFHNIQSSNIQSWDKIIQDELTILSPIKQDDDNDKKIKYKTIRCDFGPYYLDNTKQPTIQNFLNSVEAYRCDGSPSSRLRNWLSELYKSDKNSEYLLNRINQITEQSGKWNSCIMDRNLKNINQKLSSDNLIVKINDKDKTPIYDILQILSTTTSYQGDK